jgi:hypothetical protein
MPSTTAKKIRWDKIGAISGIVLGVAALVLALIPILTDRKKDWNLVHSEVETLLDDIRDLDGVPGDQTPSYKEDDLKKISFARDFQQRHHPGEWATFAALDNLPELSKKSSLREWEDALHRHERIEKEAHGADGEAKADLKSRSKALVAGDLARAQGMTEGSLPASVLKYANLAEGLYLDVAFSRSAKPIKVYFSQTEPNHAFWKRYASIDLSNPEVRAALGTQAAQVPATGRAYPVFDELAASDFQVLALTPVTPVSGAAILGGHLPPPASAARPAPSHPSSLASEAAPSPPPPTTTAAKPAWDNPKAAKMPPREDSSRKIWPR